MVEEIRWAKEAMPQVKEFFFDDDTFTDDLPRAEAIARELGKLGVNLVVQRQGQRAARDAEGAARQRLAAAAGRLRKRQPADPAQHQEGHARRGGQKRFTKDCHELGVTIHGTFIMGLPGETKETIQETIRFAREINPHTLQVSIAAPYPGTFLYKQAMENGWLADTEPSLVDDHGVQIAALNYPASESHRNFPFGRGVLSQLLFPRAEDRVDRRRNAASAAKCCKRRLREAVEFFAFLREHRKVSH